MADDANPTPQPRRARMVTAMLLGGGGGLLLGALFLLYQAIHERMWTCENLMPSECDLELTSHSELARYHALTALALGLAAIAVFLVLRVRTRGSTR